MISGQHYSFEDYTLFLDRDGVINYELPGTYVKLWEEFQFYESAIAALPILNSLFKRVVVVTNQRGVGLGQMTLHTMHEIHRNMLEVIKNNGGRIDAVIAAIDKDDHAPNRKPQIGMAFQAKEIFQDIEFSKSIMVGNNVSDMLFGRNAGMINVFITTTHNDLTEFEELIDFVFPDLLSFAKEFSYYLLQDFWQGKSNKKNLIHLTEKNKEFENSFLNWLAIEKKLYTDYEVSILPNTADYMKDQETWVKKEFMANKFLDYIDSKNSKLQILEVNCGNGWFSNMLSNNKNYLVTSTNNVLYELEQASRVFNKKNLKFVYGNIEDITYQFQFQFDIIILNDSLRFYSNISTLVDKLKSFLKMGGELHFLDCPIYTKYDIISHKQKIKPLFQKNKLC